MAEGTLQDLKLSIPPMNWLTWEGIVRKALDESEGVMNYKLSFRKAEIQFDPGQTSTDEIIAKIQKITRYKSITPIEPEPD